MIYSDRSAAEPVNVTLGVGDGDDGGALDGPAGNRDTVIYVENVIGGAGNDVIKAFDILQGDNNTFTNALFGGGGADLLLGGEGQDRLTGDKGRDILKGQGQKDHLFARDGTRDKKLDCGPGGRKESAQRDRIDPAPISC